MEIIIFTTVSASGLATGVKDGTATITATVDGASVSCKVTVKTAYTEYIHSKSEWALVKVYADEGISATSTKGREEFNAMINDCKKGLIDM